MPLSRFRPAAILQSSFFAVLLLSLVGCAKTDADRIEEASTKIASWMGTTVLLDTAAARSRVPVSFATDALEKAEAGVAEEEKAVAGIGAGARADFAEARAIVRQSRAALAHSDHVALLRFAMEAGRLRDRITAAKGGS